MLPLVILVSIQVNWNNGNNSLKVCNYAKDSAILGDTVSKDVYLQFVRKFMSGWKLSQIVKLNVWFVLLYMVPTSDTVNF